MKNKLLLAIVLVVVCSFTLVLTSHIYAANETIEVILSKNISITFNGELKAFSDVTGKKVYPLLYEGTTYLPIRAISNLFENPVEWDGENNRVLLGKGDESVNTVSNIADFIPEENETVYPLLNKEIVIIYKEKPQTFKNVNGEIVYPLSYEGTTYLPVRAIANMYGASIEWDGTTRRITINRENKLANIVDVTIKAIDGVVCAVIATDNPVYDYKYYSLTEPNRLILDLKNTNFLMDITTQNINYATIESLRFGDQGDHLSRVVLDLSEIGTYSVTQSSDRRTTYLALSEVFELQGESIEENQNTGSGDVVTIPNEGENNLLSGENGAGGEIANEQMPDSGEVVNEPSGEVVDDKQEEQNGNQSDEKVYGEKEPIEEKDDSKIENEENILSEQEKENLARVTAVKYASSTDKTKIEVYGEYRYEKMVLEDPSRLVIDIKNAYLDVDGPTEITPNNKNLTSIRFSQFEKDTVRIVFEVRNLLSYEIVKNNRNNNLNVTIEEPEYRNMKYVVDEENAKLILLNVQKKIFDVTENVKTNKYTISYNSSSFDSGKTTLEINDSFVETIDIRSNKISIYATGRMEYLFEQSGDHVVFQLTKLEQEEEHHYKEDNDNSSSNTGLHRNTVTRKSKYDVEQISEKRVRVGNTYINNSSGLTLDLSALSKKSNMAITDDTKILVYHTHTSEGYLESGIDSNFHTTDNDLNVVAAGEALKSSLKKYGIELVHDTTRYDTSYNDAYDASLEGIEKIVANDTFDMTIDLHRDAVSSDLYYGPTTTVNGKKAAKIMLVMGSTAYGLEHPYWMENLKSAILIQNKGEEMYPGLFRDMSLTIYRYNEHLSPAGMLMEVGSTGNSLEEVEYSMELFAKVLAALDE